MINKTKQNELSIQEEVPILWPPHILLLYLLLQLLPWKPATPLPPSLSLCANRIF